MELVYVDSSNVDQIGYDADEREAHVIFKNGRRYVYSDVSQETWEQFQNAPSKGTFVHAELRAKRYPYREV